MSKSSDEIFRTLVDASPAMLWTTGPNGDCTYLSKKWTEYTGRRLEDDLGYGWMNAVHPDDHEIAKNVFLKANSHHIKFYMEYRLKRHDGEFRWAIDQAEPRFDEDGNFLGFVGMVLDIHDKKLAEHQLKDALKSRDDFLSIASHELKTPLTSLKLQSQIFQRAAAKGQEQIYEKNNVLQLIDRTSKHVNRLNRLVDDMLDVSRIRTGRLTLLKDDFDFSEMTREVLERIKEQFLNADYELPEVTICQEVVGRWDRLRLEQVITNLMTNSIRYGEGKKIKIAVESDPHLVRFSITDQGIGIEARNADKIFHRFERAISSNEVSGLGLGLFISQQIILAHQGEIWVESIPGNGSTFIFEVPRNLAAKEA